VTEIDAHFRGQVQAQWLRSGLSGPAVPVQYREITTGHSQAILGLLTAIRLRGTCRPHPHGPVRKQRSLPEGQPGPAVRPLPASTTADTGDEVDAESVDVNVLARQSR
jgi:hypothetical protein